MADTDLPLEHIRDRAEGAKDYIDSGVDLRRVGRPPWDYVFRLLDEIDWLQGIADAAREVAYDCVNDFDFGHCDDHERLRELLEVIPVPDSTGGDR